MVSLKRTQNIGFCLSVFSVWSDTRLSDRHDSYIMPVHSNGNLYRKNYGSNAHIDSRLKVQVYLRDHEEKQSSSTISLTPLSAIATTYSVITCLNQCALETVDEIKIKVFKKHVLYTRKDAKC